MDLNKLRLQLIQQILQTEDVAVLQAALRVLQLEERTSSKPFDTPLTGSEPLVFPQGQPPKDEEVQQLQKDIDELFNP